MDKFQETYTLPRLNQEKNRKVIYRFSAILIKISSGIFLEILQTTLKFVWTAAAAAAKSLQSCPTLCDPTDGSPPGSPIPGILQARTLEWAAISSPMQESEKWKWKWKVKVKSLSKCLTLCDSLPGSSVHGIFQARVLEWVAIAFSAQHL